MPFGIQELATKTFVFTIQVLVPTNVFFIKLCFHQCGIQQNIAFIFWGAVKEITDSEKNPTKTMCSFSENNNWAYRRVFLEWENTHMRQISAYHNTKEDGYKEELRILKYNLDVKVQKQYQDMCQDRYNTLCWYLPTDYTHYLYPPDEGAGNNTKFCFGVYLYEWIWDSRNLELC